MSYGFPKHFQSVFHNFSHPGHAAIFFALLLPSTQYVNLNLEGQPNCMISSTFSTMLPKFFSKTLNLGMLGVDPEAID